MTEPTTTASGPEIDYEALAKAAYYGNLARENQTPWNAISVEVRTDFTLDARAVIEAYDQQIRAQGWVVVSREDLAALTGAIRATAREEMLPADDKTWTDDHQLIRRWFSRHVADAWKRLTAAAPEPAGDTPCCKDGIPNRPLVDGVPTCVYCGLTFPGWDAPERADEKHDFARTGLSQQASVWNGEAGEEAAWQCVRCKGWFTRPLPDSATCPGGHT